VMQLIFMSSAWESSIQWSKHPRVVELKWLNRWMLQWCIYQVEHYIFF